MKVAVFGDLHNNLRHFSKLIEEINRQNVDIICFTGDFDMPATMRAFTLLTAPVKAVLGNGDPDIQKFQYQMQNLPVLKNLKLEISPRFQDFKLDGKRIGIFHGDDDNLSNLLIESQLFDVLCIGHSHKSEIRKEGKTTLINPGSLVGWQLETGNSPIHYACYDTNTNQAELIKLID